MPPDDRFDLDAALQQFGLSIFDYNVLVTLGYDACRARALIRRAIGEYCDSPQDRSGLSFEAARAMMWRAVNKLRDRGWIGLIDDEAIDEIASDAKRNPCYGPLDGLPDRGCMDFTKVGGAEWKRFLGCWHPSMTYNVATYTT